MVGFRSSKGLLAVLLTVSIGTLLLVTVAIAEHDGKSVTSTSYSMTDNMTDNWREEYVNLVAGWNLLDFPVEIPSLTYYTDYYVYYWNTPSGPYGLWSPDSPDNNLRDNVGYWVFIDQDMTVWTGYTGSIPRDIYIENGWNLVGFPITAGFPSPPMNTPNNLFAPLTYYTDYIIYYWSAPSGPYSVQDPNQLLKDYLGYWVLSNQNKTVTVPFI